MCAQPLDDRERTVRLEQLIAEIELDMRETQMYTGRGSLAPGVLQALRAVPRDRFVADGDQDRAFINHALPIGFGQTISQPYIVALMTELLSLSGRERLLEIGTGSGYQAAVLSYLARWVYTIELSPELAAAAAARLEELGFENISLRTGDGRLGWPEEAPFDAIIVTAATPEIPPALIEQLKPGGRMVIPLGEPWSTQQLTLITKKRRGGLERQELLPVAFVPLRRAEPPN
jgi:protein-L-isoaspartate(D-aspartate) O-methyltransferase